MVKQSLLSLDCPSLNTPLESHICRWRRRLHSDDLGLGEAYDVHSDARGPTKRNAMEDEKGRHLGSGHTAAQAWAVELGKERDGFRGSEPVAGVLAVAARGATVAVGLVAVLVGVLLFIHVVMISSTAASMLRARRATVAAFVCSFVVVVLIRGHQVASLIRRRMVTGVVGMPCSLALLILRDQYNSITTLQWQLYRIHNIFEHYYMII